MKVNSVFWLLLTCHFLTSCVTQKKCNEKFPSVFKDTTIYRETVREITVHDTVMLPYEDVFLFDESPCPPDTVYFKEKKQGRITASVSIQGGKITVRCKEDSLLMIIKRQQSAIDTYVEKSKTDTKIIPVRDGWYMFWLSGFWVCLALVLLLFAMVVYRR